MGQSQIEQGHGMGGEFVARDWAALTVQDIQQLAQNYSVFCLVDGTADASLQILWHSPRPFSSAAIVATAQGRFFVKRTHHSFRSVMDLQQEHDFIQHLDRKGLAVSQLLNNRQGQSVTQQQDWVYEVHHPLNAIDLYADTHSWQPFLYPAHAFAAGQCMALLHQAAIDFAKGPRQTHYLLGNQRLLDQPDLAAAILQRIQSDSVLQQFIQQRLTTAQAQAEFELFLSRVNAQHQQLYPLLESQIRLWTHNDLHSSNLFWSNSMASAQVSAVIDFGLSDRSTMLYDFAVAIERNCFAWLDLDLLHSVKEIGIDLDSLAQLIHGYLAAEGRFDQIQHVALMLPLVHIDFALYELVYFIEITQNLQHAEAAYRYLIDHTAWFCGVQGQDFLQYLQYMLDQSITH